MHWLATEVELRLIPSVKEVIGPLLFAAWREGLAWGLLLGFLGGYLLGRWSRRASQ